MIQFVHDTWETVVSMGNQWVVAGVNRDCERAIIIDGEVNACVLSRKPSTLEQKDCFPRVTVLLADFIWRVGGG